MPSTAAALSGVDRDARRVVIDIRRGVSFTTLRLIYNGALATFRQGQKNSVLVITTGPHTDQTLDGPGLQHFVQDSVRPGPAGCHQRHRLRLRPGPFHMGIRRPNLRRQLQNLATSASPELNSAIATFLA